MSNLNQFVGGGVPLGGAAYWPNYAGLVELSDAGRQFLRYGTLKAYAAEHAPLLAMSKGFGYIKPALSCLPHNATYYGASVSYINSRYVSAAFFGAGGSSIKSASAIDGTWSSLSLATITDARDMCKIGTNLVFAGDTGINYTGNGTSLTYVSANAGGGGVYTAAAKPDGSLGLVCFNLQGSAGYIHTSTNGSSWTSRTPTGSGGATTIYSVAWSPCAAAFVFVGASTLYTAADGYTYTQRSTPAFAVGGDYLGGCRFIASSATSTVVSTNVGNLLRTTDGTTWAGIDASGLFHAIASTRLSIAYIAGTYYLVGLNGWVATSIDDGLTWSRHYGLLSGNNTNGVSAISLINGKILAQATSGHINEYTSLATPAYVGMLLVSTDVSNPYMRIT